MTKYKLIIKLTTFTKLNTPSVPQRMSTLVSSPSDCLNFDQIYNKNVSVFITLNMYAMKTYFIMNQISDIINNQILGRRWWCAVPYCTEKDGRME